MRKLASQTFIIPSVTSETAYPPLPSLPVLHVWESCWPEESGISVPFLLLAIFTSVSPFRREYELFQGAPLWFSVQRSFLVSKQPGGSGRGRQEVMSFPLFPASQAQPVGSRGRIPFCAITALRPIDDIVSSEELSSVTDFRSSYSIENQQKILHKRYNNDTCFKPMCSTLQLS